MATEPPSAFFWQNLLISHASRVLWNILWGMLCKSNSNAEKNAEPGKEENIVIFFGNLSRSDSVWAKNNWKECGGVWRCGQRNILKVSILSGFPQTLKNRPESRNFKETFKFLKLSPPKPHYNSVPSKMMWRNSKPAPPSSPTLLYLRILRKRSSDSCLPSVKSKSWLYLQKSSNFGYYWVQSCLLCIMVATIISQIANTQP